MDLFDISLQFYKNIIAMNVGIYKFIGWIYQIFLSIASARLVKSDVIMTLSERLMILVGIVSLFIVAVSLLKAIIDPEKEIKNTSKIFTTIITSLIMLTLVNTVFNYMYELQGYIVRSNVIGKIVLGGFSDDQGTFSLASVGNNMAADTLGAFFNENNNYAVKEGGCYKNNGEADGKASDEKWDENDFDNSIECYYDTGLKDKEKDIQVKISKKQTVALTKISGLQFFAYLAKACDSGYIDYSWVLALICGLFLIYIFISFSLDMAVRCIKLALLQIIAPIPILARIIPGQDSIFNNWVKKTITSFMEIFIKLSIVFFGVFLISAVGNFELDKSIITGVSSTVENITKVAIILGILMFVKQAPAYISEIFGVNSGDMKLGLKDKLSGMVGAGVIGGAVGSAVGAATGALGAGWSSKMNGGKFSDGMKYGAYSGWKNKGNQFNSQRQAIYHDMGFKGKAGWFGKQAHFDRKLDDVKNTYVDNYKDKVIPDLIKEKEKTPQFAQFLSRAESKWKATREEMQTKHKANIDSIELARERAKNNYYSPESVSARKQQVYDDINRKRAALLNQKSAKMAEFAKYREDQMAALRSRVGKDPTATQEYNRFKNMKFEDSYIGKDYNNQLNKLANAKFVDVKFENSSQNKAFEKQIKEANDKFETEWAEYNDKQNRENKIREWAQADMMDADETYKNYVKIQKARENEKAINTWANSMEGQKSIYAAQQGYKSAQKDPADGQKPPGGPDKK